MAELRMFSFSFPIYQFYAFFPLCVCLFACLTTVHCQENKLNFKTENQKKQKNLGHNLKEQQKHEHIWKNVN